MEKSHIGEVMGRRIKSRKLLKLRDTAIITGLIATGCRITEMLSLTLEDINFELQQVTFRQTKSGKPRTIPADARWLSAVEDWLRVRPSVASPLVFVSRTRAPTGDTGWRSASGRHYQEAEEDFVLKSGVFKVRKKKK